MKTEDDVVIAFSDRLRAKGCLVLAEGGIQAAAFRYSIGQVVKAPDVVAMCGVELLVAEGKLRSRDLFQGGIRGLSDFDACIALGSDEAAKAKIVEEVVRRCQVSDIPCPSAQSLQVLPMLFAHYVTEGRSPRRKRPDSRSSLSPRAASLSTNVPNPYPNARPRLARVA